MHPKKFLFLLPFFFLCFSSCTRNSPFFPVELPSSEDTKSEEGDGSAQESKSGTTATASSADSSQLKGIVERTPAPLTEKELEMAKIAWKFFEKNTQDNGMCNAVDQYPSTTMWDTASYIGGLIAAHELGVIEKQEFNMRMTKLLGMLNRLEFFNNELPNKAYHTQSGIKVDYANQPGEIGYSAVDMGRMLIWFKIVKERYPIHAAAIDNFVLKWDFSNMIDDTGTMFSAAVQDGKIRYLQEGRLGYEEYAAKGFQLWGIDTEQAAKMEPYETINIYGIEIPYDSRDPRKFFAHNYVVTESYVLDAIELGWDLTSDRTSSQEVHTDKGIVRFAKRIFAVQEARYKETGILTARTEHQLDQPPYFVYDTIYSDGYTWNTMDPKGKHMPDFAAIALKGAFGIWAVWDMPYSQTLLDSIGHLYDPEKGFYEGLYENGSGNINIFTANNNGIILECLLYKAKGKILRWNTSSDQSSLWDKKMKECSSEAREKGQCMREKK
ncbi:MAG: DUF3131 domain-containing protein [Candidatus Electrothrix sp. AW1]|nr:DUF3131 domain-containing protein [Candidatus Electrothrix sp. AX1]MCI5181066.1 DUF3131 domain-containing protein [Candidatus Electrothrix gigas]